MLLPCGFRLQPEVTVAGFRGEPGAPKAHSACARAVGISPTIGHSPPPEPQSEEEKQAMQKAERVGKEKAKGEDPALNNPKKVQHDGHPHTQRK